MLPKLSNEALKAVKLGYRRSYIACSLANKVYSQKIRLSIVKHAGLSNKFLIKYMYANHLL